MWYTPQPRRPCGIFAPRRALPRGQAFAKCLAEGKKMAKLLQRKLRQQEKDAKKAAKPTRVKKVSHG